MPGIAKWCCKHGAAIQGTWVLQPLSLLQLEGCRLPYAVVSPCGSCLFYLLWFLTFLSRCCHLYLNSTRHTGALLLIDRFLSFSNGVWCWRTTILSFGVMLAWERAQLCDIPTGCDKAIDPIPASSGRSLGMQEAIRYHVLDLLDCFAYMQGC